MANLFESNRLGLRLNAAVLSLSIIVLFFVLVFFYLKTPYKKSGVILNNHMEASPFVWAGHLYYLVTDREAHTDKSRLKIIDFKNDSVVSSFASGYGLASAYVAEGTLFVFGTKNWKKTDSQIALFTSRDLKSFSEQKIVKEGSDKQRLFNTSALKIGTETVVAYEVDEPGRVPFSIRFMKGREQEEYHDVGEVFGSDIYAACPTIRLVNSYYYLWYLATDGHKFVTKIARSKDLAKWEVSPIPFMAPNLYEDVNTSDVDFVTYNDKIYIFYAISDQRTYSQLTYATFDGDIGALVQYYFGWRSIFHELLITARLMDIVIFIDELLAIKD